MAGMRRTPMKRTAMKRRPADNHLGRAEWEQVQHLLLTRSGGNCEACGATVLGLPRERVEIQHRRAQGMGGSSLAATNDLANLLLLHGACHRWVESRPSDPRGPQWPDLAEQRGLWVRHALVDGEPVPVHRYPVVLWSGRTVWLDPVVPMYLDQPKTDDPCAVPL